MGGCREGGGRYETAVLTRLRVCVWVGSLPVWWWGREVQLESELRDAQAKLSNVTELYTQAIKDADKVRGRRRRGRAMQGAREG